MSDLVTQGFPMPLQVELLQFEFPLGVVFQVGDANKRSFQLAIRLTVSIA